MGIEDRQKQTDQPSAVMSANRPGGRLVQRARQPPAAPMKELRETQPPQNAREENSAFS